jgi:thiosulfate/3-mercaptopyruvate sulfurtransferase
VSEPPIVSAAWLEQHLADPRVRIAQIRYETDVDDYADGHIPGAQWWYWKDATWHPTDREFASPEQAADWLGRHGVTEDTTLVLYSGRNQYATYTYWVLKEMCGHPDIRVLDGGRYRWKLDGRPLTTDLPDVAPVEYRPRRRLPDLSSRVGRDQVRAGLGLPGRLIVDARTPEEYRGERVKPGTGLDHGAERYGHIPGAVNIFFRDLLGEDFTFKRPEELRRLFEAVGASPEQVHDVIVYCRLSHRASLVWFAMRQIVGWDHVRIYDGSWTEWGSIVGFPVERWPGSSRPGTGGARLR